MNYFKFDIVFQEVPGEISLAIYFTGCPLRCKGCHSTELWNAQNGQTYSTKVLAHLLQKYRKNLSCVLFMGGEWEPNTLIESLRLVKTEKLKCALYTGREREDLSSEILEHLDYLKTGPWKEELGGLTSPTTNQRFYILTQSNQNIDPFNDLFKEDRHVFETHR